MRASILRSLPGVASLPRSNRIARTFRQNHLLPSTKRKETTRLSSSLGDASFDFIKSDADDKNNGKAAKNPDLVPLLPDAPRLPSNDDDSGLYAEYFDEEGNFGPLSLLAVGLCEASLSSLARLLEEDLEAKGVVPCFLASEEMLRRDLRWAFEEAPKLEDELCLFRNAAEAAAEKEKENASKRRSTLANAAHRSAVERPAIVLSGMSSAEVLSVVTAWRESGCAERHAEVLFCAAVPGNWTGRTLAELIEDISGDAASVGA